MATTRSALTESDIRTLVKGATAEERAAAAHKLCRSIDDANLSDEDREAAAEILRVMASDASELVRRALVVTLKASPLVPRDVALKLARDVEDISLPMLSFSPVFLDTDLADIVRLGGPVRQVAIARRPMLSPTVTVRRGTGGRRGLRQRQRRLRRRRPAAGDGPLREAREGAGRGRLPQRPAALGR
jgi:uncharacterized protein (DUF2336 family)